jgi:hypothetical protein
VRYLFVTPSGVLDTLTGELVTELHADVFKRAPGGVIVGRNLYPILAPLLRDEVRDCGLTGTIHGPPGDRRSEYVGGAPLYVSRISYRHAKEWSGGKRYRPGSVKWIVLNLELFCESTDIEAAGRSLVELAERRGIAPRPSPGAFGAAMLRASSEWNRKRTPAPWFISEAARTELPGNFYIRRAGYSTVRGAYYLDQKSSHHSIVSSVDMPHPKHLHARGHYRAVEDGRNPPWKDSLPRAQVGLVRAVVECDYLPQEVRHLYPPWARERGKHARWIWTPELRLFDRRVRLRWISASLTSSRADPALHEYAEWSLEQLGREDAHAAIKPALLAAYGMLAVRSRQQITHYSVHGRSKPPRADVVKLPLLPRVFRSTVESRRVPTIQNVVARGVIEAECRARSIELARRLEGEGRPVVHIYADGLIVACDTLPLDIPVHWSVKAALSEVSGPEDNQIVSKEMVRLPGIPGGRRTAYLRRDNPGEREPGQRSSLHLRECEPVL